MGPKKLLKEFEKKLEQLLLSKKHLLEVKKLNLFL